MMNHDCRRDIITIIIAFDVCAQLKGSYVLMQFTNVYLHVTNLHTGFFTAHVQHMIYIYVYIYIYIRQIPSKAML